MQKKPMLALHPATELINDAEGEQFIVKMYRSSSKQ